MKMAWTHMKTDTAKLESYTNDDVQTCIQVLEKEIEGLTTDLTDLDAMWDGPSSEAFKKNFAVDIEALRKELFNLQNVYKYCDNAKKKYEECENRVIQIVDALSL